MILTCWAWMGVLEGACSTYGFSVPVCSAAWPANLGLAFNLAAWTQSLTLSWQQFWFPLWDT